MGTESAASKIHETHFQNTFTLHFKLTKRKYFVILFQCLVCILKIQFVRFKTVLQITNQLFITKKINACLFCSSFAIHFRILI